MPDQYSQTRLFVNFIEQVVAYPLNPSRTSSAIIYIYAAGE